MNGNPLKVRNQKSEKENNTMEDKENVAEYDDIKRDNDESQHIYHNNDNQQIEHSTKL